MLFWPKKLDPQKIKTIFIYSNIPPGLGDAIAALPFMQGLRFTFPTAHITWGVRGYPPFVKVLLDQLGFIDEFIEDPNLFKAKKELFQRQGPLGGRQFDLIYDLQSKALQSLTIKRMAQHYFISPAYNYLFSDIKMVINEKNMYQRYATQIAALSPKVIKNQPIILKDSLAQLEAFRLLPNDNQTYIAIAPGAHAQHRRLPIKQVIDIARGIKYPVIFLGIEEGDYIAPLQQALPHALFPLQEARSVTLALLIECVKRCQTGIASDSGYSHVFSLANLPSVVLYYYPHIREKWIPPMAKHSFCATDFKTNTTCSMDLIPTELILSAVQNLLPESGHVLQHSLDLESPTMV